MFICTRICPLQVGAWHFDKRTWSGRPVDRHLKMPPDSESRPSDAASWLSPMQCVSGPDALQSAAPPKLCPKRLLIAFDVITALQRPKTIWCASS
jgi:hypothetical protein